MEYRDPLALIMARDEVPVIDVKRIAKLFKDKDISDRTKSQLLYKDGPGLLDTWSAYEASRKETRAGGGAARGSRSEGSRCRSGDGAGRRRGERCAGAGGGERSAGQADCERLNRCG